MSKPCSKRATGLRYAYAEVSMSDYRFLMTGGTAMEDLDDLHGTMEDSSRNHV